MAWKRIRNPSRSWSSWVFSFLTLLTASSPLCGETTPPPPSFTASVNVAWVLVPVVVRSPRGLELKLQPKDFRLRVDGSEVPVQEFDREREARWSLLLVQDLSGSMGPGGRLGMSQAFARCFTRSLRPGDEMAIASFSGNAVQVEVPFTRDREALEEAISLWEPSGTTALYDAVSWIPEITLEGRELRRVAVLVTDGADNASRISPNEARELVVRAQIPVYVLGFDTGSPYRLRRSGEKVYRYADVLNLLAHTTGGKYFSVSKTAEILEVCREILAELQFQYLLAFPAQAESSEALHRIEVELVNRPQWFVRSRRHYFGGSPVRQ